jgi:hypothetical protein
VARHVYFLKVTRGNNVNTFGPNGRTQIREFIWTGGDLVRFTAARNFLIRLEIVKKVRPNVFKNITDRQSPLNATVIVDSSARRVKKARRKGREFMCRCTLIDRTTHQPHGWEKTEEDKLSGMDPVVHN